jgi:hypothetical protein
LKEGTVRIAFDPCLPAEDDMVEHKPCILADGPALLLSHTNRDEHGLKVNSGKLVSFPVISPF